MARIASASAGRASRISIWGMAAGLRQGRPVLIGGRRPINGRRRFSGPGKYASNGAMLWLDTLKSGPEGRRLPQDGRSPFQQDADRIVFSSAFRRMQDKTQVHPQPQSDYVRTRLTHSMEVASVGRSLGGQVARLRSEEHTSDLQSLMRSSYAVFCLKQRTYSRPTTAHHCLPPLPPNRQATPHT